MLTKEVTLENVLAENIEKSNDAPTRVLAIRSYFRWAVISEVFKVTEKKDLPSALQGLHQDEGLSIRDITAQLQDKMQSLLADKTGTDILENAIFEVEHLLLQMTLEHSEDIESAIYGSSRPGSTFDLTRFLTKISKNAVIKIVHDLGIQTRGYDERLSGKGYKAKKGPETRARMKKLWADPEVRIRWEQAIQESWNDPARREAAANSAREQLASNPAKRLAFRRTKKSQPLPTEVTEN